MNLKIISILVFFFLPLLTISSFGIVDDPHRPQYSFSDEVFKNLPPYPLDLPEIRHLYATQTLKDYDRLTPEYYLQPEFYPGWFDICNKTYTRDPRIHGKFGAGFYPSKASITIEKGMSFELTTLLYTSPGVECYQGTMIELQYNKSIIKVEVVQPNQTTITNQNPFPTLSFNIEKPSFFLLLKPTYPCFSSDWVKKFKIRITALREGNTTLIIKNSKPPKEIDDYYIELLGRYNYTSGNTFFGMNLPSFKASIKVVSNSSNNEFKFEIKRSYPSWVIFVLMSIIVILLLAVVRRWLYGRRR